MCGIVGVYGNILPKDEAIFKDLLRIDVIRGSDSTGIAVCKSNLDIEVFKRTWLPDALIEHKNFKKALVTKPVGIIGHNRFATKGKVEQANAHPFVQGGVVGVHNGTLSNHHELPHNKRFAVDSENIMYMIETLGIEKTIPMLQGAYCLVWFDKNDDTFNMIRNEKRPLYITTSKTNNTMYYASEGWMLSGVLGRHGVAHEDIKMLPVDTHVSWKLIDSKHTIPKPMARKLEGKPEPLYQSRYYDGYSGWDGGYYNKRGNVAAPVKPVPYTPSTRVLQSFGIQWGVGHTVSFIPKKLTKASAKASVVELSGIMFRARAQEFKAYIPEAYADVLKLVRDNMHEEFTGSILNVWRDNTASHLNILLDPKTFRLMPTLTVIKGGKDDKQLTLAPPKPVIVDADGNEITLNRFSEITKQGCAWCSEVPLAEISAELVWCSDNDFICPDCSEQADVKDYLQQDNNERTLN